MSSYNFRENIPLPDPRKHYHALPVFHYIGFFYQVSSSIEAGESSKHIAGYNSRSMVDSTSRNPVSLVS